MRMVIPVALLLIVPALVVAGGDAETTTAWRTKADEPLLAAFDAGADTLKVVIQGPQIPDPVATPADRAAWRAHWDNHAAPFLDAIRNRIEAAGGTVTTEVPAVNALFAAVPSALVPELLGRSDVRRAGLDWEGAVQTLGTDSLPGIMANLPETIAKVQAQDMWALGYRGAGVTLAVIDTGIRPTHEMMRNADGTTRVVKWSDHTTTPGGPGYCATPCDANGHGTHVATTAAGSNLFNPSSPQGVAPEAEIWGVRIFQGGGGQWEWAQGGLQWSFNEGADITTNSWGGGCSNGGDVTAELAETLQNAGMMNVFAAGNSGTGGVLCPGVVENVITVGGIDVNDNIYSASSRGPCEWPLGSGILRICPDVNAVAVNVVAGCHQSDTHYCSLTGTSMATPHVAGVVVLLEQAKKAHTGTGLDAAQREAEILLRYSAKDLGPVGPDNDFGWGTAQTVDAYQLLKNDDALNLIDLFTIERPELRGYETSTISFALANLGQATVSGHLTHTVEQITWGECPPACYTEVITNGPISMSPFSEFASRTGLDGAVVPAGDYRVQASFAFEYLDGDEVKTGLIEHEGFFTVKKVDFRVLRLAPEEAIPGEPLLAGVMLSNLGNEDASNVRFRETYPVEGATPLPAVPPGLGPYGVFANPAPDQVAHMTLNPLTLRYDWNDIGDIPMGDEWEAAYNFAAGQPGTYEFRGTLRYTDETGRPFLVNIVQELVVALPV